MSKPPALSLDKVVACPADQWGWVPDGTVDAIVTSPPAFSPPSWTGLSSIADTILLHRGQRSP
jgi:hypothetical protein